MIYLNGQELENLHIGDKEIQKVLLGESLIWENNKVINLGEGTAWNIRELYPNLYDQLTADNFFFLSFGTVNTSVTVTVPSGGAERLTIVGGLAKAYNPSTGVLNFYPFLNSNFATLTAVLVTKPEKLTYLGLGTVFNLKTMYPNEYQNFTVNNFLVRTIAHHNGGSSGGSSGIICNEYRGNPGTYSAYDTLGWGKTYNAETGVLNIYALDVGGTDNGTSWSRTSTPYVYLTKKRL